MCGQRTGSKQPQREREDSVALGGRGKAKINHYNNYYMGDFNSRRTGVPKLKFQVTQKIIYLGAYATKVVTLLVPIQCCILLVCYLV